MSLDSGKLSAFSAQFSVLSGQSLSDVSNIAVFALPICLQQIPNMHWYHSESERLSTGDGDSVIVTPPRGGVMQKVMEQERTWRIRRTGAWKLTLGFRTFVFCLLFVLLLCFLLHPLGGVMEQERVTAIPRAILRVVYAARGTPDCFPME
jgi:hypothetical protein